MSNPNEGTPKIDRAKNPQTTSGIELPRLIPPSDSASHEPGPAGVFPFTHGIYPDMYRERPWTMRQYAGFSTAEESNRRYHFLLGQGVTGLSVAFDLPTQIGYDSDDPMALGEVGKVGVPISTLEDMRRLFLNIPLDQVSTSMTINAPAAVLLAMYICVADETGVPRAKLRGTIQNDILKEYVARGTYIFPPAPSLRIVTDLFSWCGRETPQWNTISISGYHIREAGATAAQEIGFTLAHGICYVNAAIAAGLDVNTFGQRLSFFFNAHSNLIEEVAKFRAARRMWAHIMRDRFGATDPRAHMLRFHTQTAGSTLTAQQPENNIIRTSLQALSAVLGGTQSLHTNGFDEALSLPTERAARIALRTQQIIAHESGVTDMVDPLAGSYAVEYLTDELERRAYEYIAQIDAMGGAVKAIERHYMQGEIATAALAHQRAVEQHTRIIVGVNQFTEAAPAATDVLRLNEDAQGAQVQAVRAYKSARTGKAHAQALIDLKQAATGTTNLMPPILAALKAHATLGEICHALREVFGEYTDR